MANAAMERPTWETQGTEKRDRVQHMFNAIAPTYDRANRIMSFSLDRRWRNLVVRHLNLKPGDAALDICSGTGDFLLPLRTAIGPQGELAGLDFSSAMLEQSRSKPHGATLILGDAGNLPVADSHFDAVTVGWGIRNVPDIDRTHREIARVLKPGGRFASLDMAVPRNPILRKASAAVAKFALPLLGKILGAADAYRYLPESTERFWDRERLADSMRNAGFVDIQIIDLMGGNICAHIGRKPSASKP